MERPKVQDPRSFLRCGYADSTAMVKESRGFSERSLKKEDRTELHCNALMAAVVVSAQLLLQDTPSNSTELSPSAGISRRVLVPPQSFSFSFFSELLKLSLMQVIAPVSFEKDSPLFS